MTAIIRNLPGMATRCRRLTANAKAEAEAEAIARAVKRAKAMIDDPRRYTDAQMGTACAWLMKLSSAQRDDDGNVYYQRADQIIFALERQRQVALNKVKFQATLARIEETPLRIAMRYRPQLLAWLTGGLLAVLAAVVFGAVV